MRAFLDLGNLLGQMTRGAGPGSPMTPARGAVEGQARARVNSLEGGNPRPSGRGGGQVNRLIRWLEEAEAGGRRGLRTSLLLFIGR